MSASGSRVARPRPAASLILLRQGRAGTEVLIGRRRADLSFMPGVFAFPGGKLDREDHWAGCASGVLPSLPQNLDKETAHRHAAFLRAALRELHEETGLFLALDMNKGVDGPPMPEHGIWSHYARARLVPAFSMMRLVARAITPTASRRRFHNRFFSADGRYASGTLKGSGELEEIAWVPIREALGLPMAEVGTLALREALAHRQEPGRRSAALFQWHGPGMKPRIRRMAISRRREASRAAG